MKRTLRMLTLFLLGLACVASFPAGVAADENVAPAYDRVAELEQNRSRTARTAGPAGGTAGPARVAAPGATGAGRGRRRWWRRGGGRRGRGPGGTGAARRRRTGPERAGKGPDRERKVGVFRPVAGRRSLEADEPKLGVPQRRYSLGEPSATPSSSSCAASVRPSRRP